MEEKDASDLLSVKVDRRVKPTHWFQAGSVSGADDYCFEDRGLFGEPSPRLLPLLLQLEKAIQQPPVQSPALWGRLSLKVRQAYLIPALARLAHARDQAGDLRARRVFWWLVDEEATRLPPTDRHQWALYAWQEATDGDLQEVQRRLGILNIELDARARRATDLIWSKLPWSVVERRLMAPGLMERMGQLSNSQAQLILAVQGRGEWAAWGRLVHRAGPLRACFLSLAVSAFEIPSDQAPHPGLAHLSEWVSGPSGRVPTCDPSTALLAIGAGCLPPEYFDAHMPVLWLQAGLVLDPESVARALSPAGAWVDGECQLEPAPSAPFPYRVRKR